MKNKIDRITIPQKLGKKQSKAVQVNDTHSHCLQIYMHFHNACVFISFPKNVSINYYKTHSESYFFIVKLFYCHKNIIPGFLYICKKHLYS